MNKEIANEHFPLYRVEVCEELRDTPAMSSDESELNVNMTFYQKDDVDSDWYRIAAADVSSMLSAFAYAGVIYHRVKCGDGTDDIQFNDMKEERRKVGEMFPLQRVVVEEFVYGRDTGSPWSDPENDIRKSVRATYDYKSALNGEWESDYDERFGSFEYGILKAGVTAIKLIEQVPFCFSHYMRAKGEEPNIVMFEAYGHMFKFKYHFPDQKCVCGDAITDYINDYEGDRSIKVDYMESHVFLYEEGVVVYFMGKLYLNGEAIVKVNDLKKFDIDYLDIEFGNENFKKWLNKHHPEAKKVTTIMSYYGVEPKKPSKAK